MQILNGRNGFSANFNRLAEACSIHEIGRNLITRALFSSEAARVFTVLKLNVTRTMHKEIFSEQEVDIGYAFLLN